MKFYTISAAYVTFLKGIDGQIPDVTNVDYQNPKPFIGIVLDFDGHKYLAPLTSPKPWHDDIKSSSPKYFKIHETGVPENKLGLVNLKFMFPVLDSEITLIDLDNLTDEKYQRLLYNQLQFIRANAEQITKKSKLLRVLSSKGKVEGTCNFAALENAYKTFK
ncbi:type III toxin-antitoxin system ToxN/AbiQ family toxin [Shewanella baltica]|uniref:type III toxin-antitoxin system ToxN/AbiQ family toxin n=1 Tax=Shewanella baltica TaxID=62322 RepID=UPI003D7ADA83